MPNWCNNTITISGPTDTIKQLWEDAHWTETSKDEDGNDISVNCFGLLQAMAPMPKELNGTTSPSEDGEDWYTWRVNNWGTKWDVDNEGLEFQDHGDGTSEITGWFDSAWSPPVGAYEKFCDDMDNCSIDAWYEEGGMDFAGHWHDGQDDFLDGISDYARDVIKNGTSSCDLYDELDEYFDITEQRREWIEEELEQERKDEKRGLYAQHQDVAN